MNDQKSLSVNLSVPLDRFHLEVSFATNERVTGIFGVSGSGKTTLLKAIAGIQKRARGRVQFGDTLWQDSEGGIRLRPERRGIGYVPQESLLFPHKTVRGNLLDGGFRAVANGHAIDELFQSVIAVLKLEALLDHDVATLSGGETRRVALGRAICSGPQLLLMDEPLASLDIGLRQRVLPFLRRVRDQFDLPMLLVSHDPVEIQALCDYLIVLRDGKIIGSGNPRSVLTRPDIFPIAENEGFENTFSATIVAHSGETSTFQLGGVKTGLSITGPKAEGDVGDVVLVSIPAHEILLATTRPVGLSARNILPAEVRSIEDLDKCRLVVARLHQNLPDFVVEVTEHSVDELEIQPGARVFLIMKSNSLKVYG